MNFNLSQRAKLFDEDRSLLGQEMKERYLRDTYVRRKINENMPKLFERNMKQPKKKGLISRVIKSFDL